MKTQIIIDLCMQNVLIQIISEYVDYLRHANCEDPDHIFANCQDPDHYKNIEPDEYENITTEDVNVIDLCKQGRPRPG